NTHEGQSTLSLPGGQSRGTLTPVGKCNRPARTYQPGRLGNQSRLVRHVTPRILTPDEVGLSSCQAAGTRVAHYKSNAISKPFFPAKPFAAFNVTWGQIHTHH